MKQHQRTLGKNDEWLTPPQILRALGEFDLDPCAVSKECRPWSTARSHFAPPSDGLLIPWFGRVWLNPPFNRYQRPRWMQRMAEHGEGIMLIPAATETQAFEDFVWRHASAICFVKSRPHFHFVSGARAPYNSGTAICLCAYGRTDAAVLQTAGLGQTLGLR